MDTSSDGEYDYYEPDVVSASDYYPFGMQMVGRTLETSKYRYGFNGKEKDNEIKGEGNSLDFGARIYDPRIGRFNSLDPDLRNLTRISGYSSSSNNPIVNIDNNGEYALDFRLKNFLTKNSYYTTGFIYGIGDGLIEIGAMGFDINKVVAAFNPVHLSFYYWRDAGAETRKNFRAAVSTFIQIARNRDIINQVIDGVKSSFGEWWDVVAQGGGTNGERGYAHGKLVFDVVSLFVGTGELKGLMKGSKIGDDVALLIRESLEEATQMAPGKGMPEWLKLIKEGLAYETSYFDELTKKLSRGDQLIRRVTFKTDDGTRAVVDGVVRRADGTFELIETKLKYTTPLTKNQQKVYKALKEGKAMAVGDNAKKAGFKNGEKVKAEVKRVNKHNSN